MRMFVAVDLDDDARAGFDQLQKALAAPPVRGRSPAITWVRPQNLHVTLAFMGEITERVPQLVEVMRRPIQMDPFEAAFGALGAFPPRGAPRTLWVGVPKGTEALIDLQLQVTARLREVGIEIETRPFHPHVTLARWREGGSADRRWLNEASEKLGKAVATVARIRVARTTLYRSEQVPGGSVYTALACAELGGL